MRQILIHLFGKGALASVLLLAGVEFSSAQSGLPNTEKLSIRKVRGLATNSLRMGDTYSALVYYKEWSKRKPENVAVSFQLAELYRNSRDYAHASESYWKVLKSNGGVSKYPMALFYAGDMDMQTGKYAEAKSNFIKFKRIASEMKEGWWKKLTLNKIEGCEYAIYPTVFAADPHFFESVDQFSVEAHITNNFMRTHEDFLNYGKLLALLRRAKLELVSASLNWCGPRYEATGCPSWLSEYDYPCSKSHQCHNFLFAREGLNQKAAG